jgi:16S rRNA (cytosine967-C5)-methyltransferase
VATAAESARGVSPARACAFAVIRRVFEQDAYADRALHAEARGLSPRDRGLATALTYGAVQRRLTLDHVAAELGSRSAERLDPPVLAGLRLGLLQLLFLDGVADHAAVNETVELVKRASRGGAGYVNAVLRRAIREGPALLASLRDDDPDSAAVRHSVPPWLARQWWAELGADATRRLLTAVNQPAESALRVNGLVSSVDAARAMLPDGARPASDLTLGPAAALPEALVLEEAFDAFASDLFAGGAIMPQSRASMLVSRVLAPSAGQRVLDLCAAPGGKTTHLAALIGDDGEVVAVERHPGRAEALKRTAERMRARSVRVVTGDAAQWRSEQAFERVLVDPPCSGLGTLQSRPDLRWRARPEAIDELAELQGQILDAGAAALAPGGRLVYSVCTISRREGRDIVSSFLQSHSDFTAEDLGEAYDGLGDRAAAPHMQLLPSIDGTDGFFIAALRRV